jgi:hypothetical protein
MAKQVDAGTSMNPSTPVSPEERFSADHEWMQQHADLARFLGGVAMPLALLAQQARTATANAGGIHYAEAAISLSTVLLGKQRVSCWAPKRSVWLERKVCARKAACFPGGGRGGWSIPRDGRCGGWTSGGVLVLRREGRSKLGGAHRVRMKLMPQLQAQVPDPLGHQLPALLPPGRVAAPPIGIDLLILV